MAKSLETLSVELPRTLRADAHGLAEARDITIGHLVCQLLAKEVDRRLNAKRPNRADEQLVAALQALLARDMALATSWEDLAARLGRQGYELRPAGGGLTLHRCRDSARLCKGSELGFAYRALVTRFRAAMPGHPQGTLGLQFDSLWDEEDDQVIEAF